MRFWPLLLIVVTACSSTGPTAAGGCAFPQLPAADCSPWLPAAAAGHAWQLTFSEEFSGATYDPAKLTPCFDWNYGGCTGSFNQRREYYAASQIQVNNGAAHLGAEPTSPPIASNALQNGSAPDVASLLFPEH